MNVTVKRKFNALLQGIGNRPSTSATDPIPGVSPRPSIDVERNTSSTTLSNMAPPELETLAKKRRVGALNSNPSKYGALQRDSQNGKTPTTISNVILRKWTPTGTASDKEALPKYCPGDREQLLRRLATFQELTDWAPKPDRVSEIEWAKRGWVCQGKERVKCTLCNNELAVKLNRKEVRGKEVPVLIASDIEEALVENYTDLIVSSHQENCLWRKRGCDDSLLRIPDLPNPKAALANLRTRYDELCARKDFLPYEFNLRLPQGLDIDAVLSQLPPNFFTEPPPQVNPAAPADTLNSHLPKPNRTALALAILGWQGLAKARIGAVPNSSSCHSCLRRLGLWMFKSKEVDPETGAVLVAAPMDHLDPLREHRFFCPWKSGAAQRNPGSRPLVQGEEDRPAWEILVQVLRNEAFVRRKTDLGAPASTAGHARSKSTVAPQSAQVLSPTAPARPATGHGQRDNGSLRVFGPDGEPDEVEDEDEESRKKKDKDMMTRLRRVKSLFNTKAGNKLRRMGSRPGTAHSSLGVGE